MVTRTAPGSQPAVLAARPNASRQARTCPAVLGAGRPHVPRQLRPRRNILLDAAAVERPEARVRGQLARRCRAAVLCRCAIRCCRGGGGGGRQPGPDGESGGGGGGGGAGHQASLGDDAFNESGGGDVKAGVPHINLSRHSLSLEVRDLQAGKRMAGAGAASTGEQGRRCSEECSSSGRAAALLTGLSSTRLLGGPLLDGDEAAVVQGGVDRGRGRGNEEGHVMVVRRHRVAEGANLVGCSRGVQRDGGRKL